MSLDGYIARRNGSIDFLVIDKDGEKVMADFFSKIDATIMGRKTASAHLKQSASGEMPSSPGVTNYVISRRWKPGKRAGLRLWVDLLEPLSESSSTGLEKTSIWEAGAN